MVYLSQGFYLIEGDVDDIHGFITGKRYFRYSNKFGNVL